jgi:tetratricopeptide (TPR) repeat protein
MAGPSLARRGRLRLTLTALACLLAASLSQWRMEASVRGAETAHPLLYLPSGRYLKLVSLGFDGLVADVIYLWSIQFYGNFAIADRYDYLEKIYGDVIAELDPLYLDPYLIGSMIMTTEARNPEMALRLLDKGIEKNPGTWILSFEAGFICYDSLHDYTRAARYFEKALRAPDVHPLVRRLYAGMYERAGDRRTSLKEWAEIYRSAQDDYVRNVAWNHVHDLKVQVDLADLEGAVTRFRALAARPPRSLAELVQQGVVAEVPTDPEERDYLYNPATGIVSYRARLILAR